MTVQTLVQKSRPTKPSIKMRLRTQHAVYLRHIARRDDSSVSSIVRQIIETNAAVLDPCAQPSRQEEVRITIAPEDLALLNCLSLALGIDRSDIMRRMIDKAMAEDPILRLAG